MGKVSPYQQKELASAVTGTAGVDNSGAILANAEAGLQNERAKLGLQGQEQVTSINAANSQEMQRVQAQGDLQQQQLLAYGASKFDSEVKQAKYVHARAVAAQTKFNEDARTANDTWDLNAGMGTRVQELKDSHIKNPDDAISAFRNRGAEVRPDFIKAGKTADSQTARARVYDASIKEEENKLRTWATTKNSEIQNASLNDAASKLGPTILAQTAPWQIGDLNNATKKFVDTYKGSIETFKGAASTKFTNETVDAAIDYVVYKWAQLDPYYAIETFITTGQYATVFSDAKKAEQFVRYAKAQYELKQEIKQNKYAIETLAKRQDIEGRVLATRIAHATDPEQAVDLVAGLIKEYKAMQALPLNEQDTVYMKRLAGQIGEAFNANDKVAAVIAKRYQNDDTHAQLIATLQEVTAAKQKAEVRDARSDKHNSTESLREKQAAYLRMNDLLQRFNQAPTSDKQSSGINAKTLHDEAKRLTGLVNNNNITEAEYKDLLGDLNKIANDLYAPGQDSGVLTLAAAAEFLNLHLTGPSEAYLRAMGIQKIGPDGKETLEYFKVRNDVREQLKKDIKAQNIPANTIMNPATKAKMYATAMMAVLSKYINSPTLERNRYMPVVEAKPTRPALVNANDRRKQARGAAGPSHMVPPPPPGTVSADPNLYLGALSPAAKADLAAQYTKYLELLKK